MRWETPTGMLKAMRWGCYWDWRWETQTGMLKATHWGWNQGWR